MKKLSVLLVAVLVAVSATANVQFNHQLKAKNGIKAVNTENTKVNIKEVKAKALKLKDGPVGETKSYDRAGQAVYYVSSWFSSYITVSDQTENPYDRITIVYGENNQVYLKNIIFGSSDMYGDYWVEGTIEGNQIYVPLGQLVSDVYSEDYGVDVVLGWGTTSVEGTTIYFEADERAQYAIYTINEDGTIALEGTDGMTDIDPEDPACYEATGLALVYAGNEEYAGGWDGFIEWNTVLTEHIAVPAPNIITEIPEGCNVYTYYRNSGNIGVSYGAAYAEPTDGKIEVAFDLQTGKVYIHNPLWWADALDTWVEGTYDWMTGIITVPTGQYLAWSEAYEYGIQLVWGSTHFDYDEEWYEGYYDTYITHEIDENVTEIKFMIDDDYIYLLDTQGNVMADYPENFESTGMMGIYSDDLSIICCEFANRDEYGYAEPFGYIVNLVPAVPANPTADEWYDCGDETGFSKFYFTLPDEDINGNPLDPEYVSYSIFVDNGNGPELFTFSGDVYTFDLDADEEITEVLYSLYSNAVDFHDYYVYMYRTNAEGYVPLFTQNIGIQVYYTVDGVKNASDIVWLYDQHVGVNELNDSKTVANVRYFNVAGQEMAQPEGITIKVTTYTDGTKTSVKVVK